MIMKRFFDTRLAQTSYLIGCGKLGSAIVVDPNRDVDQYVRAAAAEGVRITHVTETHIHADFVSGARELAAMTGAQLFLSDEGDAGWKYEYAGSDGAILVKDGITIEVGNIAIGVVHTPGHTPEHISFLVTDTAVADEPIAMLTGDFVFVGDVGRPDLLEKAAGIEGTMEHSARTLYASLQRFSRYDDWMQIWPGHGAGSACGKGLSAVPHSTVGYERRFNWAFNVTDEAEFVRTVLAGQPEPPTYFARMKEVNKRGPDVLRPSGSPGRLDLSRLSALLDSNTMIVDTRPSSQFAARHIPGTINIPLNKSFTTWAGWFIPFDRDFHLIAAGDSRAEAAMRDLSMIGLDNLAGWFDTSVIDEWNSMGNELGSIPQISSSELLERMRNGEVSVVDVRGSTEWDAGHIPGVENIPVGRVAERAGSLKGKPLVVHCQSGARSAIAASLLRANGVSSVTNLTGGFSEWEGEGNAVERGAGESRSAISA